MDTKLNLKKVLEKKATYVSTKEALKDVTIMPWSDEVTKGKKKIIVSNIK